MLLLIILVVVLLAFGGVGYGYRDRWCYGYSGGVGILGALVLLLVVCPCSE